MAEKKTVRLTHQNGVNVSVREDQAEALRNTGLFTDAKKSTSTSSKSSSK